MLPAPRSSLSPFSAPGGRFGNPETAGPVLRVVRQAPAGDWDCVDWYLPAIIVRSAVAELDVLRADGNRTVGRERKEALADMQSSAATAFRAVVMLVCLIAVPLAALVGTELPELGRKLLRDHLGLVSISSPASLTEGPPLLSTAQAASPLPGQSSLPGGWGAGGSFAPAWSGETNQPGQPPHGISAAPSAIASVMPQRPPVSGGASPIHEGPTRDAILASYEPPASSNGNLDFLRWPEDPANASANPLPAASPGSGFASQGPAASHSSAVGGPASGDRFNEIQRRFRLLGATYTLLETWGDQGQLFRFYCRMGMAGSTTYSRYFEATDAEPLVAMARVLEQVETWRSAGQP